MKIPTRVSPNLPLRRSAAAKVLIPTVSRGFYRHDRWL